MPDDRLDILRCPHCASRGAVGMLVKETNERLLCQEPDCNRVYPIDNGLPIMLTAEGDFLGYRKALESEKPDGEDNG